jgi:hypothetical protein
MAGLADTAGVLKRNRRRERDPNPAAELTPTSQGA